MSSVFDVMNNKAPCPHGVLLRECNRCGCSRCHSDFILADTEDWKHPLCPTCDSELGEPTEAEYEKIREKELN